MGDEFKKWYAENKDSSSFLESYEQHRLEAKQMGEHPSPKILWAADNFDKLKEMP